MRHDAKKDAADELQVQEKEAVDELPVKESPEDSAFAGVRTRETDWGQELAKTIASTIAGMARPVPLGTVAETRASPRVTGKRECAKTSQRESWTKTALGYEQIRREGRVCCPSRLRTWSECDGGSNSDCCRVLQARTKPKK